MGLVSLDQQNNHGIMDDDDDDEGENNQDSSLGSNSSSDNLSNFSSSDSELFGEELGEGEGEGEGEGDSTDPNSPNSSSSDDGGHHSHTVGGLQNMSTLLLQLPFKRGLSKHYNGKSQSFTSLSNVRSLEDMAKPENPYTKKLKSCKSYGVFSLEQPPHVIRSSSSSSRLSSSSKRGSCSSLRSKRSNGSFLGNITSTSKPPVPPHRSTSTTSFTTQTPLFA